jgi:hypothetical protein
MTIDNTAINATFPEPRNRRLEVIFRELLGVAVKQARQCPVDRDLSDLISRARAIAAGFDSGVK